MLKNFKFSDVYMKNLFKREMKNNGIIHQHSISNDYCHGLKDIKILNDNDLHIHLNLGHGHEHVCFDVD